MRNAFHFSWMNFSCYVAAALREASPKWEERLGKPIVQQYLNLATV